MRQSDVVEGYRSILGREPENDAVVAVAAAHFDNLWDFVRSLLASPEARLKRGQPATTPFRGYTDADAALVRSFYRPAEGRDGYVTNFVGAVARTSIRHSFAPLSGSVQGLPFPDSFHGDPVEWVGVLRAVSEAQGRFSVAELGAGWGPWLVASSLAAKARGISDIYMTGVEADAGHFAAMSQHLLDNGFSPEAHRLLQGAVGPVSGTAFFPIIESERDWGAAAVFSADAVPPTIDYRGNRLRYTTVRAFDIDEILADRALFDLVHVDIQGTEREAIPAGLEVLNRKVRWLVIGVHSRAIEGMLIETLSQAGWQLTNEKPTQFRLATDRPITIADTFSDGTQVWRNRRH